MFSAVHVVTDPHYTEYGELQTVCVGTCQMIEHSSNGNDKFSQCSAAWL
jgi:hypothetical protein